MTYSAAAAFGRILCGVWLALLLASLSARAGRKGSPRIERGLADRDDVIFFCDFEAKDWYREWGARAKPKNGETVEKDDALKFEPFAGRALRVAVTKGGHYGISLTFNFKKQTGAEPEEIYFRYYLRLAHDWDPARGGKMPGIGGTYGRAGWGGRKVNGRDGWSARGLFKGRKNEKTPMGFYCYHADMPGTYGENWLWDQDDRGYLANNRWYCIEQYAKMNTPGKGGASGKKDGVLRAWVDGQPAFEKTDVRMRDVDTLKIETVWLNVYHGGKWTARTDDHLYVDNVVIAKKPIGPMAARAGGRAGGP